MARRAMLFGLTPLDPGRFIGVAALFAVVAAVAAAIPAHRATKLDPLVAVRND
jgi:ABC-type antimicrobial peptide transport system permease subunit